MNVESRSTNPDRPSLPRRVLGVLVKQLPHGEELRRIVRGDEFAIFLPYSLNARPRYGEGRPRHRHLEEALESRRATFLNLLRQFGESTGTKLAGIPLDATDSAVSPYWNNLFFTGLDAGVLYSILVLERPHLLIEVGSGNSTKFARRAITDFGLPTRIISIDPAPRSEIDELCDEVIRVGFEEVDPSIVDQLGDGDILFVDGSHHVFTNSDVTALFLDFLPRLRKGVLVHLHDIFLPDDYPSAWADRFYSEQYLLALLLLTAPTYAEVVMPNHFVCSDRQLAAAAARLRPAHDSALETSFWLRIL